MTPKQATAKPPNAPPSSTKHCKRKGKPARKRIWLGPCSLACDRGEPSRIYRHRVFIAALAARTAAEAAKERAIASRKAANKLNNFMQYDLERERSANSAASDIMDAINARICRYHEEHPAEAGDIATIDAQTASGSWHSINKATCSALRATWLARSRATATALELPRSLPSRTPAMRAGSAIFP